jgi:phosphoenolpyruvate carboxykinase (GTP)
MSCKHAKAQAWVKECQDMMTPDSVHWCDGSKAEYDKMVDILVKAGSATPLKKRPNSYLFRSDPSDVARVEDRTYIASKIKADSGPSNNWVEPAELKKTMKELYAGCMKGRIMYVIPFAMGPFGGPITKYGIEITDSAYVVINMIIMTRVSTKVWDALGTTGMFIPCLHSIGAPLKAGQKDALWPCAPIEKKYIAHFPEEDLIWSYGSGYGGNALLGKKCFALRIASNIARREGDWMAEHMLIMRLTSPAGKRYHLCAAFPSACGKTNLAMLQPTIAGWKVETLGDDISWMKVGPDGYLHALNPESGFFGVAPGTSNSSNPMAMECLKENVIFTNCVLTDDGDIWWEGMGTECKHGIDWKGNEWTPEKGVGAHPNARFTTPARQCPIICPDWEDGNGVAVNIICFGGRRATTCPLVHQAFGWDHGVFLGAQASSETTAANIGAVGELRRDPMAMKPFCGYNMGDYWQHWLNMGDKLGAKAPKVFYVNWFRKNAQGKFMWPGYGDNSRVLKWMCERHDGAAKGHETAIGILPQEGELDLTGLKVNPDDFKELLRVDKDAWKREIPDLEKHFNQFGDKLPPRIKAQVEEFKKRLA